MNFLSRNRNGSLVEDTKNMTIPEWFDARFYYNNNEDIRKNIPFNVRKLYQHYVEFGRSEGRKCRNKGIPEWFDASFYYETYPDIREKIKFDKDLLYDHYKKFGKSEGRVATRNTDQEQIDDEDKPPQPNPHTDAFEKRAQNLNFTQESKPQLSILIVTFNRFDCTIKCLESLSKIKSEVNFEILIFDNASSDGTPEYLEKIAGITLIKNDENLHFLRAINRLAPRANGEFILLLNNDAEVTPGSLKWGIKTFYFYKDVGTVGGKIILNKTKLLQEAGNLFINGKPSGYGRGQDPRNNEYNFSRQVVYCSGCFLIIRKSLFQKMNYFDEDYSPAYFEETDLSVRLLKMGYQNYYQPRCVIYHEESASKSKKYNPNELMRKNSVIFQKKHGEFIRALPKLSMYRLPNERRNIIWLESIYPLKNKGSGYPRLYSILKYLAKSGWFITYISYWADNIESNKDYLPPGIEFINFNKLESLDKLIRLRPNFYRGVVVSRYEVFNIFRGQLQRLSMMKLPIIYDMETLAPERDKLKSKYYPRSQVRPIDREIPFIRSSRLTICVSENEKKLLEKKYNIKNLTVFGHYIKIRAQQEDPKFSERKDFLFFGYMAKNSPNTDSIIWFLKNIWPMVHRKIPEAKFNIIGDYCPEVKKISDTMKNIGVNLLGKVTNDQLKGYCKTNRVFIAPTRYFSGIPFKIHHAASMGIPIVANRRLVENIGWGDDTIVMANIDDRLSFSDACVRLYRNEDEWNEKRNRMIDRVGRDCGVEHIKKFEHLIKSVL